MRKGSRLPANLGLAYPLLLIVAAVLIVTIFSAYRFYFNQKATPRKENQSQVQSNLPTSPTDANILHPNQAANKPVTSPILVPPTNQTSSSQQTPSTNNSTTFSPVNETGQKQTLENAKVGYRLNYPTGWQVKGAVVSSEFQAGANECQSVEIVDSPTGDGGAANYHSGVQVCAKLLNDSQTLDDFMINTYAGNLSNWFTKTSLNGIPVYQSTSASGKTIFAQTNQYRLQIYTFVSTTQDKQTERTNQVEETLQGFSLI